MAGEPPILTEEALRDPKRGAERSSHDPLAAADGLEPPDLRAGLLAGIGSGAVVFVIAAMLLMYGFYRLVLGQPGGEPVQRFPAPRLETSINPRDIAAGPEPGPAPLTVRKPPVEPAADIQRAVHAVAARGEHAYDPAPVGGGNSVQ